MIRHIVMFSAKNKDDLDTIESGLMNLTQIPGAKIEITRNQKADQLGNDIDIVVYGEFPDLETLNAYKRHPLYEKSTSIVRPLRELRFAADIEAAT
ncbi:MAG TPA: Dabb family protein [Alphaproteobacteria bacterium]|nr:Dabb family protein [Alphaproteobacteria bacterium]USO05657.1 MAG: Dabb family protein [Rhodospirillales bacterium]HOO81839.1 Dabb family protein [Alphaproteobacteria bacterium]